MKEVIIKKNIYDFDELDEEIQNKLIDEEIKYQEENYCESFLLEDMQEEAQRLLEKNFKNADFENVYYDLSYCQGSGAMIEFNLYYYNKYVEIKHQGYYNHERSFIIDCYELTEKQEKQLKEKIIKINKELTKFGYREIEYYWSNEAKEDAKEYLKEHTYFESGVIYE